jgi:hypothetical protein
MREPSLMTGDAMSEATISRTFIPTVRKTDIATAMVERMKEQVTYVL